MTLQNTSLAPDNTYEVSSGNIYDLPELEDLNAIEDATDRMQAKAERLANIARRNILENQLLPRDFIPILAESNARRFTPIIIHELPYVEFTDELNYVDLYNLEKGTVVEIDNRDTEHPTASYWIIEITEGSHTENNIFKPAQMVIWHKDDWERDVAGLQGGADLIFTSEYKGNDRFLLRPGVLEKDKHLSLPYFNKAGQQATSSWGTAPAKIRVGKTGV